MGTGVGEAIIYGLASATAGAAVNSILNPAKDIPLPKKEQVKEMPDPLAQNDAQKKKIIEQMQRSGRSSTILTDNNGTLGG